MTTFFKRFFLILGGVFWLGFFGLASGVYSLDLRVGEQKEIDPGVRWNQSYVDGDCSTKEDKCLFVWRDKRNDPGNENDGRLPDGLSFYGANSNADIYGLFVKGDGTPIGSDFLISVEPAPNVRKVDQAAPEVVYNPVHDEFFVVWHEADPRATSQGYAAFCTEGGYDIYAQRVSPTQELLGNKIVVSKAPDCQWKPRVAYDPFQDVYLITWHDHRYRYSTYKEIFGQFVRGNGELLGENFLITYDSVANRNVGAHCYQEYSAVAFNQIKKEFLVVWADDREKTADCGRDFQHDIWGQRLSWENEVKYIGGNFPIYKGAGIQNMPEVAFNPNNGGYFVVWHNYDNGVPPYAPFGMKLSGEGVPQGRIVIDSSNFRYYAFPTVETEEITGNYLVAWERGVALVQGFSQEGEVFTNRVAFDGWAGIRPTLIYNKTRGDFLFLHSARVNGYDRIFYSNIRMSGQEITLSPTPLATATVTLTPVPTQENSPIPTPICLCPNGAQTKSKGDANCDNVIDERDFRFWLEQFRGNLNSESSADFNCDGKVDGIDFEYWRRGNAGGSEDLGRS